MQRREKERTHARRPLDVPVRSPGYGAIQSAPTSCHELIVPLALSPLLLLLSTQVTVDAQPNTRTRDSAG